MEKIITEVLLCAGVEKKCSFPEGSIQIKNTATVFQQPLIAHLIITVLCGL